ncbi:hypothetical protein DM01DRAFT_1407206 [Hesseltinella vesiculosa]|uniref:Transmembrane protein n=1 Tax=Hesseltinella vesiculosa TaxID=101127 RepID=A0A1X2GJI6_9FUNG|nr:hypothetical protein DM01DRAFT_1407206 [Hesseltinella vesiculosa]
MQAVHKAVLFVSLLLYPCYGQRSIVTVTSFSVVTLTSTSFSPVPSTFTSSSDPSQTPEFPTDTAASPLSTASIIGISVSVFFAVVAALSGLSFFYYYKHQDATDHESTIMVPVVVEQAKVRPRSFVPPWPSPIVSGPPSTSQPEFPLDYSQPSFARAHRLDMPPVPPPHRPSNDRHVPDEIN